MGSGRRRAVVLLAGACGGTLALDACKDPTQVTVDITTLGFPCDQLKRVTVVVAADPESAEEKADFPQAEVTSCESKQRVGTLVLTPAQDRGAVMVLASYTDQRCQKPDYKGCIVARRAFSFVDHVKLVLPIALEASCKDVPCGVLSSCRSGQCVSSQTTCESDGTCKSDAQPVVDENGNTVPPDSGAEGGPGGNDSGGGGNDSGNPTDAGGPETAADGRALVFGNMCPSNPAGVDCYQSSMAGCCVDMDWHCDTSVVIDQTVPIPPVPNPPPPPGPTGVTGPCGGASFQCTGRLHCGVGHYCCSDGGATGVVARCEPASTGPACGVILCNTSDDCPNPSASCVDWTNGPHVDGGSLRRCEP